MCKEYNFKTLYKENDTEHDKLVRCEEEVKRLYRNNQDLIEEITDFEGKLDKISNVLPCDLDEILND
jgi:hypothetical protein